MVWVTEAEYLGAHRLRIRFNDGHEGVVDLRDTIFNDGRPIFLRLRDPAAFQKFTVSMDTVSWANGLDLAPEYLYQLLGAGSASTEVPGANTVASTGQGR